MFVPLDVQNVNVFVHVLYSHYESNYRDSACVDSSVIYLMKRKDPGNGFWPGAKIEPEEESMKCLLCKFFLLCKVFAN